MMEELITSLFNAHPLGGFYWFSWAGLPWLSCSFHIANYGWQIGVTNMRDYVQVWVVHSLLVYMVHLSSEVGENTHVVCTLMIDTCLSK